MQNAIGIKKIQAGGADRKKIYTGIQMKKRHRKEYCNNDKWGKH